jgi:glycosyltransferase involved in cell wall biosynthesis
MAAHGGDDLPFVLKDGAPSSKGIVVFTHKERSVIEEGGEALAPVLEELREHYLVAMHWGHYAAGVEEIPWVDVHLAAPGTLSFAPGVSTPRIPMASRNFIPGIFHDRRGARRWDVLSVARPLHVKNLDQLLRSIRIAYDRGHRITALLLCPCGPVMKESDGWYTGMWNDYIEMFSPEERELVTVLMLGPEGYPFPVSSTYLAGVYNDSKSFALFSDQEGESRVVAEALLCGLWILAKSDVRGGAGDYLTEGNSRRFSTPEEAADALIELHATDMRPADSAPLRAELSESETVPRLREALEALLPPGDHHDRLWHVENLARELPSHVLSLPTELRREYTNDLAGPTAALKFMSLLLGREASAADIRAVKRSERARRRVLLRSWARRGR